MDVSEPSAKSTTSASRRGSSSLIMLGSAAVLAIYGAGYLRTRDAAQRFAAQDSGRRPAASAERGASTRAPAGVTSAFDAQIASADAQFHLTLARRTLTKSARTRGPSRLKATTSLRAVATTVKKPQPAPVPVAVVAETPAPVAPPPAPAPQTVDPAPRQVEPARKGFRDGTYTGWGTSRHGDIEASVEIRNGAITSATITQCLTRYSCSRIASIIPQVVERQSAAVDYVSGATQSSDAFSGAIAEALSKAK